jgi:hypothetical protein
MSLNGGGTRDIARVPNISTNTVLSILKNRKIPNKPKPQIHKPKATLEKFVLKWLRCVVECIIKRRLVGCGTI